jgi:hypothetical protein
MPIPEKVIGADCRATKSSRLRSKSKISSAVGRPPPSRYTPDVSWLATTSDAPALRKALGFCGCDRNVKDKRAQTSAVKMPKHPHHWVISFVAPASTREPKTQAMASNWAKSLSQDSAGRLNFTRNTYSKNSRKKRQIVVAVWIEPGNPSSESGNSDYFLGGIVRSMTRIVALGIVI